MQDCDRVKISAVEAASYLMGLRLLIDLGCGLGSVNRDKAIDIAARLALEMATQQISIPGDLLELRERVKGLQDERKQ